MSYIFDLIEHIKKHIVGYGPIVDEYGNVMDENTVFVGCDLEYSSGIEFHHKPESCVESEK